MYSNMLLKGPGQHLSARAPLVVADALMPWFLRALNCYKTERSGEAREKALPRGSEDVQGNRCRGALNGICDCIDGGDGIGSIH